MYKVLYYDIYAKYYQSIKQYQQASAYIDTTLTMLKKDFTSDYAEQLLKQAKIWVEAGDNNRATTLYQQALAIKDSAAMALSNTQMEQIKKSYNLDKIELEQQKQTNQIRLISLIVISAILIVLFISLFRLSKIRKALKYSVRWL
jgi:tetratricopeptide (TPR) repeat protein